MPSLKQELAECEWPCCLGNVDVKVASKAALPHSSWFHSKLRVRNFHYFYQIPRPLFMKLQFRPNDLLSNNFFLDSLSLYSMTPVWFRFEGSFRVGFCPLWYSLISFCFSFGHLDICSSFYTSRCSLLSLHDLFLLVILELGCPPRCCIPFP